MSIPNEEHEKTISYLYELDPVEDPLWHFLQSYQSWILTNLNGSFSSHCNQKLGDVNRNFFKFMKSIDSLRNNEYEIVFGKDIENLVYEQHLAFVKDVSNIFSKTVDFWKFCRAYFDEKYKKVKKTDASERKNKRSSCFEMFQSCVESYISIIDKTFQWIENPESSILWNSKTSENRKIFVKYLRDQVLISCYFLPPIITNISDCFSDIMDSQEFLSDVSIKNLLLLIGEKIEHYRKTFIIVICKSMVQESSTFYNHENWKLDPDTRATFLAGLFESFMIYSIESIAKLSKKDAKPSIVDLIRNSVFESFYRFLDSLHFLAFQSSAWKKFTILPNFFGVDVLTKNKSITINPAKKQIRLLALLNTFYTLNHSVYKRIENVFESKFGSCSNEIEVLTFSLIFEIF
jgi:hypothetical protein